jgi:hypothetical protein
VWMAAARGGVGCRSTEHFAEKGGDVPSLI